MVAGVSGFMAVIGIVYRLLGGDPAGVALLAGTSAFAAMAAAYLLILTRNRAPLPEDRDADPGEDAGVVGEFSVASVWPLLVGLAAAVTSTGLAFGVFPVVFGGALLAAAAAGLLAEGWRR
jgi:hypothetical protein